jgi:hypothetical protein
VSRIEERLREAFNADTQTIRPGTIRDLDDLAAGRSRPAGRKAHRRARFVVPLTAAAAVSVVAVVMALVVPRLLPGQRQHGLASVRSPGHSRSAPAATVPYAEFFVALTGDGTSLGVGNATTGAMVARVMPPRPGLDFSGLAAGNGHTFVATLWRAADGSCKTWLYRFTLNDKGQPSALTPFAALPETSQLLGGLALSQNGQKLAYLTTGCPGSSVAYLAVMSIATGQTRQWAVPERNSTGSLSLTANGKLLAYGAGLIKFVTSAESVLPTDSAAGTAAERSRLVAKAAQFGSSAEINSGVITPDGAALYFTTNLTGSALANEGSHERWQLRVTDLATGQSHAVTSFAGFTGSVSADPSGRYLLLQLQPTLGSTSPPAAPSVRLARLDIATGQVTYLHAAWLGSGGWIAW